MNAQDGTKQARLAYLMATIAAACLIVDVCLAVAKAHVFPTVIVSVCAIVCLGLGMGFAFSSIRKRGGIDFWHLVFNTWFPFIIGGSPVLGIIVSVWGAARLFKGKIGAVSIITSDHGTVYNPRVHRVDQHGAVDLKGLGKPAGTILLLWAFLQPIAAVLILSYLYL